MHDENMAILKGLVAVAWADGTYADKEREVINALLEAFEASPEEAEYLRTYADTPRTVEDIPVTELSYDDRRILLQHAVYLTFVDGGQQDVEREVIDAMVKKLRIGPDEAQALIEAASERAKRHLTQL